jgi:hypothetical protein
VDTLGCRSANFGAKLPRQAIQTLRRNPHQSQQGLEAQFYFVFDGIGLLMMK